MTSEEVLSLGTNERTYCVAEVDFVYMVKNYLFSNQMR